MTKWITALAAALVPIATASADDDRTVYEEIERDTTGPLAGPEYASQVTLGAGLLGTVAPRFVLNEATGMAWNVRYAWHPANVFGLEVGYVGAVDGVGEDAAGQRVSTLGEAAARIDLLPSFPIEPMVALGLGYGTFAPDPDE